MQPLVEVMKWWTLQHHLPAGFSIDILLRAAVKCTTLCGDSDILNDDYVSTDVNTNMGTK